MAFVVGIIGVALAVVAAGVGTWQAVQSRQQAADEADAIAEQKDKEAQAARDAAAYQEQQHRRKIALLSGKQEAITAAAGVSLYGGSPQDAELDLATQSELEALNIRRGGQVESQAKDFEARLSRYRASSQRSAIKYDIAGGVLQASSGAVQSYAGYKGYNQYRRQLYGGYSPTTFTNMGAGAP